MKIIEIPKLSMFNGNSGHSITDWIYGIAPYGIWNSMCSHRKHGQAKYDQKKNLPNEIDFYLRNNFRFCKITRHSQHLAAPVFHSMHAFEWETNAAGALHLFPRGLITSACNNLLTRIVMQMWIVWRLIAMHG